MKPNNHNFRFFIEYKWGHGDGVVVTREVFPINTGTLKIVSEKQDTQIFFRKKLSGNPILINNESLTDYSYLKSFENGSLPHMPSTGLLNFKIKRRNGLNWDLHYTGQFCIYNLNFDDDRCTVEITNISVLDEYSKLLNNKELEFNLFDITPVYRCKSSGFDFDVETRVEHQDNVTVTGDYDLMTGCFELWYQGFILPFEFASSYLMSQTWFPLSNLYDPVDPAHSIFNITTKWVRAYKLTLDDDSGNPVVPDSSGTWVQDIATTLAGLPAHKWLKNLSLSNYNYFNLTYLGSCNKFEWTAQLYANEYEYKYNRKFTDIIQYTLNQIVGVNQLNLLSHFLNDTVNPVTNEINKYNLLLVSGKSDVKNPYNTEPQTLAKFTFSMLENWLLEMFQCYWYIDGSNFVVEHISSFNKVSNRNLRNLEGGKYIKGTNKYNYKAVEFYSKEEWKYMESNSADFKGMAIEYPSIYPVISGQDTVKSHSIKNLTTEIDFIEKQPQEISNEGFVMFACNVSPSGYYYIINDIASYSFQMLKNAPLSIANLQEAFFKYNRLMSYGKMNHSLINFYSSLKLKEQVKIKFPLCAGDELDENYLITTGIGDGEVSEAEFDLKSEMQEVTLIY